jgi:predicted DNA binding CopG/RHH family protein
MAINQELLDRIDAEADSIRPDDPIDFSGAKIADESPNLDEKVGLKPISIRFPVALLEDLKAMALINGMGYQPLIREICHRFVEAEKRAIAKDQALRRLEQLEQQRRMVETAQKAVEEAERTLEDAGLEDAA